MALNQIYHERIRPGIVAFVHKYVPKKDGDQGPPVFPPIIGTGFVVRTDGVIATNAHVVRAFSRVFRPKDAAAEDWGVFAYLFHLMPEGLVQIPLEILGAAIIDKFDGGKAYYGPKKGPDVAFVHVKARNLPILRVDSNTRIEEGMDVCTAGFPMGTDALTAPGWLHQLTPTLQMGIVSAVMPFVCPTPHAFSANIMTQGGASGSPVFLPESGEVVGILYAGLKDFDIASDKKTLYRVPTAISYVVPAHYLQKSLDDLKNHNLEQPPDAQSIEDMLKTHKLMNALEHGTEWLIKTEGPEPKLGEHVQFNSRPPS